MPQALGLRKRKKQKTYPLIEILGPMDCGKRVIGSLVSKRIFGTFIPFPVYSVNSMTGRALMYKLHTDPRALEENPEWWANMSLAHLQEFKIKIEVAREVGPVVVSNYLLAFRLWFRALDLEPRSGLHSLPEPNIGFKLQNLSLQFTDLALTATNFSLEFLTNLKKALYFAGDRRIVSVEDEDCKSKFTYVEANRVSMRITEHLHKKYKLEINPLQLYTSDSFIPKKDR